jgi:prepilin-type N-terminal cleavage/methylation domain-containing protein
MRREEKRAPKSRERGFTLLELMVAIAILSIGILAVATMQSSAIRANHRGYRLTESTTLAQDRLEYLISQPYDDLDDLVGVGPQSDPWVEWATDQGLDYDMPSGYTLTYRVTQATSPDPPWATGDPLFITINVQGRDGGTLTLDAIKTNVRGG